MVSQNGCPKPAVCYYYRMSTEWKNCSSIERVDGRVSGAWVFKGTRVPVVALFENIEDGASIDDFLEWFPGVTREQIEAVLEHSAAGLALRSVA
jgi:uncharacterized protein (DUF433 family)